ncbi:hypothetical protein ALQ33_102212 [Pseudomonas syringae pv. philadelphi]|uniref:Uncharacterized protein n=1 Tax=Pseudomonas syringae pv. philadelphi TaxID=251706 RepID=A0A3M3YLH3_9PSED|nr:hypothetical protein ALQ33_102212 [Pseudomonas syringae pv. philadelphi]
MPPKTGPSPTESATRSPPWACFWKTAKAARPGVWRTDQDPVGHADLFVSKRRVARLTPTKWSVRKEHHRAHAPRGHAVLDAPRPILDVRPAERQKLNNPLFPQPLVQRVAAHPQLFGQQ